MNHVFKIVLIFLVSLAVANTANSTIVTSKDIEKQVIRQVSENLKKYSVDSSEVTVINVPFQTVEVPDGKLSVVVDEITTRNISSRAFVRVVLYVNEQYSKSFGIPVSIKAYQNVLIARDLITKDSTINQNMVTAKKIDITNSTFAPITYSDIQKGITAVKPFQVNEIISKNFVKIKPDVAKNAMVIVVFDAGNDLCVSVEAVALSDGNTGDFVNAQNKQYKKVYTGKVVGENRILVKI